MYKKETYIDIFKTHHFHRCQNTDQIYIAGRYEVMLSVKVSVSFGVFIRFFISYLSIITKVSWLKKQRRIKI